MKKSELQQIIREEIGNILNENSKTFRDLENENFKTFSDLESAIDQYEKGNDYYNLEKLKNIFNQLKNNDQVKAREKYSGYFPSKSQRKI